MKMREITIFILFLLPLLMLVKLHGYVRAQERKRCPLCLGRTIALQPGGRPDEDLCEKHYRAEWHRSMRYLSEGDGESAKTP